MELGFILLKILPKVISMSMELEVALDVQFTKIDLVMFAIGKLRSFTQKNPNLHLHVMLQTGKSADSVKKCFLGNETSALSIC